MCEVCLARQRSSEVRAYTEILIGSNVTLSLNEPDNKSQFLPPLDIPHADQ